MRDIPFGSQDGIDDALDILDKSNFEYIVITGVSANRTRTDTNMSDESKRMILRWARSGSLEEMLVDSFKLDE